MVMVRKETLTRQTSWGEQAAISVKVEEKALERWESTLERPMAKANGMERWERILKVRAKTGSSTPKRQTAGVYALRIIINSKIVMGPVVTWFMCAGSASQTIRLGIIG